MWRSEAAWKTGSVERTRKAERRKEVLSGPSLHTLVLWVTHPCKRGTQKPGISGNSLAVQCLGLHAATAEDIGSIPDWGTKVPPAAIWPK